MTTYVIYWRKVDEEDWHKITANEPITYTQEIIDDSPPTDGYWTDYSSYGGARLRACGLSNVSGGCLEVNARKYEIQTRDTHGNIGRFKERFSYIRCDGWNGVYGSYSGGITVSVLYYGVCGPGVEPGTKCKTTFSTGFEVTEAECVIVKDSIECPCCKKLLGKANAILGSLS